MQRQHAVGVVTDTFVDATRSTVAWGPDPVEPSRTLVTTVWYPATGSPTRPPRPGAAPDRSPGGYPLIVFAHGLGSDPLQYEKLLTYWAAAGFVVAAPRFPLTSDRTPGGPDAGDVVNQPGDMSFVITSVLRTSARAGGVLSGMVDPAEVGAAGHSNGAITTLGLIANSCCRDRRVKAAVVMAGDDVAFPGGTYDLADAPPLLLVHGTADELLPYSLAVGMFNGARGPKGLVTIDGGGHESAAGLSAPSSASRPADDHRLLRRLPPRRPGGPRSHLRRRAARCDRGAIRSDGRLDRHHPAPSDTEARPPRLGYTDHGTGGRPGGDGQMERLHPRKGRQHPAMLPERRAVEQLVGLHLRQRQDTHARSHGAGVGPAQNGDGHRRRRASVTPPIRDA